MVIEIISDNTALKDKTVKKQIYQDRLRVPEYYWYDPFTYESAGFRLCGGKYEPIVPTAEGQLPSEQFNLLLVKWEGIYGDVESVWLRWARPDGTLLPTSGELAERERQRAEQERLRAEQERERAEAAQQRERELEEMIARYRERFGDLPE